MAKKQEVESCGHCGASVYPEHIESGKAEVIEGILRCPFCLEEYKKTHHTDETRFEGQATMNAPGEGADFTPIKFDDTASPAMSSASLRSIGGGGESFAGADAIQDESHLKRSLVGEGTSATRCRTFHAKLNDGAVAFLNKHVNDWADEHPDVFIKFATSTIGVWEAKKADPHLIVTVFY